jgi:hypothetical protein
MTILIVEKLGGGPWVWFTSQLPLHYSQIDTATTVELQSVARFGHICHFSVARTSSPVLASMFGLIWNQRSIIAKDVPPRKLLLDAR